MSVPSVYVEETDIYIIVIRVITWCDNLILMITLFFASRLFGL